MGQSKSHQKVSLQNKNLNLERIPPTNYYGSHYVPESLTQPLAQAKMVTNNFGNRNFMQSMGRLSMHSWWALVFSVLGAGGGYLLFFLPCSQCVPNMFSLCSLEVPQVVTEDIPNRISILSHMVCPKYINWKGGLLGNTFVSILQLGSKEVLPLGECSMLQKNCWSASEYGSFQK
jgi:hypothetical protein